MGFALASSSLEILISALNDGIILVPTSRNKLAQDCAVSLLIHKVQHSVDKHESYSEGKLRLKLCHKKSENNLSTPLFFRRKLPFLTSATRSEPSNTLVSKQHP